MAAAYRAAMLKTYAACLILAAALSPAALASIDDIRACASIADPAGRLACFDAAVRALPAAIPAPPPPDPKAQFGKAPSLPPEVAAVSEITSVIVGAADDGTGRLILNLANSQTWALKGYDRPLPPRPDTRIRLTRGFLIANYLAELPSGSYQASRIR